MIFGTPSNNLPIFEYRAYKGQIYFVSYRQEMTLYLRVLILNFIILLIVQIIRSCVKTYCPCSTCTGLVPVRRNSCTVQNFLRIKITYSRTSSSSTGTIWIVPVPGTSNQVPNLWLLNLYRKTSQVQILSHEYPDRQVNSRFRNSHLSRKVPKLYSFLITTNKWVHTNT